MSSSGAEASTTTLVGIPVLADERGGFSRCLEIQRSDLLKDLSRGEPVFLPSGLF